MSHSFVIKQATVSMYVKTDIMMRLCDRFSAGDKVGFGFDESLCSAYTLLVCIFLCEVEVTSILLHSSYRSSKAYLIHLSLLKNNFSNNTIHIFLTVSLKKKHLFSYRLIKIYYLLYLADGGAP